MGEDILARWPVYRVDTDANQETENADTRLMSCAED
jgi:hypothetical protein